MAGPQGTSARSQRLNAVVAMCLLATATSLALGRVFTGRGAFERLVIAGLASALLACAMERRNLFLATAASAAGMIVAVGLLVFPGTTLHGLPTMQTLHAIGAASKQVAELARVQTAPTPPLRPLLLAALTSVWAAIFSAHALAFRTGSPLLALLPPVALVAFADTVMDEAVRPLYGVAFLAAALAVVFADALRRVQGWGPIWAGSGRSSRLSRTAGRSARRVAAVSVGLALMAPVLVPGFGSKAVIDLSGSDTGPIRFDPLVSVAAVLTQKGPAREVMRVQTDQPSYLRMEALPDFDGTTWRPNAAATTQPFGCGGLPSTSQPTEGTTHTSTITVVGEPGFPGLPVPYPTVSSTCPPGDTLRFVPSTSSLILDKGLDAGSRYEVHWVVPSTTPAQLRAVTFGMRQPDDPEVALPANTPAGIRTLAKRWTQGEPTTYDKIIAIQDELRNPADFQYSTDVGQRDDSTTLLDFLTTTRRGFCQQFASAMAVMLRTLGIPARVAVGFSSGHEATPDGDVSSITNRDAHSWVEVEFPGYGWQTFDPTPGIENPATVRTTGLSTTPVRCPKPRCVSSSGGGGGSGRRPKFFIKNKEGGAAEGHRGGPLSNLSAQAGPRDPWRSARPIVLLAILAGLVAFALLPPLRALRRRARLRRAAHDPMRLILTTYDVFTERAAELGLPRRGGETVEEYRRRVVGSGAPVNGHLDRLSSIVTGAAYAPRTPDRASARAAADAASSAWKDLKRGTPLLRRLAGAFRRP